MIITFRRCRRHAAPEQGANGALMAEQHHQGRNVSRVGERNAVHHGGPLGGYIPHCSGEDVSLCHTGTEMLCRFKALH